MLKIVFSIVSICLIHTYSFSQSSNIFELNKKLGKGINMGNMFEAPTETEWGNPFKDDYFQRIASLGFNHVRIPIRWDTPARTLQTAPYTINKTFIERIKYVIDKALAEKLYVVINMHHHDEIFTNPDGVKPRFLSQWMQIAEYFKNYDERVVFEVMNEPHDGLNADKWNVFFADALSEIRKVSKTRAVLIGTSPWGGLGGVSSLKIPNDANLIFTVHYYDPFNFTHQGAEWVGADANNWLGTKWENTNLERNEIINQFQFLIAFAKQNNIPVHVGEFGAYSKADLDSRVKWSNFLARWFEQQGFSWAYWEFSAGFGIFNPANSQYLTPLVDALLKNPMSEPVTLNTKTILESKFEDSDNTWNLAVQPQAKASYTKSNGSAIVEVTQASTDGWHVQFVKNEVSLKKDKRYLVSFDASATVETGITNYLGKAASPYNAYSGYKGFTLTKDLQNFTYSFVMSEADDPKSRVVFDFGLKAAKISIKNFVVKEVVSDQVVLSLSPNLPQIQVFPNPASEFLVMKGIADFKSFALIDLNGKELISKELNGENETNITIAGLNVGQYIVLLRSADTIISKKIIKF